MNGVDTGPAFVAVVAGDTAGAGVMTIAVVAVICPSGRGESGIGALAIVAREEQLGHVVPVQGMNQARLRGCFPRLVLDGTEIAGVDDQSAGYGAETKNLKDLHVGGEH